MGPGSILQERRHSQLEDITAENQNKWGQAPFILQWQGLTPSELRSRREERMENGVKNLKGSEAISQNLLNFFLVNALILR